MPAVTLKSVRTRFAREVVLDGVSFEVERAQFVCLVGPSGCGKSTTLRLIGGLIADFDGEILVDGEAPARSWQKLAYVFQSPRLAYWRTALDNIILALDLRYDGLSRDEKKRRALAQLELVGLGRDGEKYPGVLSGGEKQRVSIARALVVDPEIILMDEPLSDLDVVTKERLRDEIIRLWETTQKTIIFVTHDLDEAIYLADRVIVFSNKPTAVLRVIDIDGLRPRQLNDEKFAQMRRELRLLFRDTEIAT